MTGWWLVGEVVAVAAVVAAATTWVLLRKGLRELAALTPPVGTDDRPVIYFDATPRHVRLVHPDADNPTHTLGGTS